MEHIKTKDFILNRDCEIIKFFKYHYEGDIHILRKSMPTCTNCKSRENCAELYSHEEGIKIFSIVANNLLDVSIEITNYDFNNLISYINKSDVFKELGIICENCIDDVYSTLSISSKSQISSFLKDAGYGCNSRIIIEVMNYLFLRAKTFSETDFSQRRTNLNRNGANFKGISYDREKQPRYQFLGGDDDFDYDKFYFNYRYYNDYHDDFDDFDNDYDAPIYNKPIRSPRPERNLSDEINQEVDYKCEKDNSSPNKESFTYDMSPILKDFIGLDSVKEQLQQLRNRLQFEKVLGNNFNFGNRLLHTAFVGNPGVGKSMIGKEYARILYEFGYIKENKVIFAKKADLIGEYIGHTPKKTQSTIDKSLGGVLFIDEAYTLTPRGEKDFAHECIEVLIANMTEKVGELVVIFAGYKDEIFEFFKANPGIESRVPNILEFEDYSNEELLDIMKLKLRKFNTNKQDSSGFKMTKSLENKLLALFESKRSSRSFGNARFAENMLNKMLDIHANYCCENSIYEKESLLTLDENCIKPYIDESINMFSDKKQNDIINGSDNNELAI